MSLLAGHFAGLPPVPRAESRGSVVGPMPGDPPEFGRPGRRRKDRAGQLSPAGHLMAIRRGHWAGREGWRWVYACIACGHEREAMPQNVEAGRTKTAGCGCSRSDAQESKHAG